MGPWTFTQRGQPGVGAFLQLNVEGDLPFGYWVQEYLAPVSDQDVGGTYQTNTDPDGFPGVPFYPAEFGSGGSFYDNPGRGAGVYPATWTAQASYVTRTLALTFQWGYSRDAYGNTNYNLPKVTTPWPATQQLIQQAQSALNANTVIIIGVTPQ
jgi:hypothetical protein